MAYGYARKRKPTTLAVYRPYKRPYKKAFVAGKDRTGGYYGRFGKGKVGELKFHDVTLDDAIVATSAAITASVNLIAQGVTESTRVGRKCTIRSVHWRYQVTLPKVDAASTSKPGDSLRILLYVDKQCNGATIAGSDLFETDDIHSFRNLANSNRFTILCDKIHNIGYQGMASDGAGVVSQEKVVKNFNIYKKLMLPIEYSSTTGAIGEIRSNNIGVLLISASGEAGFNSNIRLRFSDGS